jgi:hypothetical protein
MNRFPLLCTCGLRILQYKNRSSYEIASFYFKVAIQYRKVIRDLVSSVLLVSGQYHYNSMLAENEFNVFIDKNPLNLDNDDLIILEEFNTLFHNALRWLSEPQFVPDENLDWQLLQYYWKKIGRIVIQHCAQKCVLSFSSRNCRKWTRRIDQLFVLAESPKDEARFSEGEDFSQFLEWLHMDWFHGRFPSRKSSTYSSQLPK